MTVEVHIVPDGYMVNGRMVTVVNGQVQNLNELNTFEEIYLKQFINNRQRGLKIQKSCTTVKMV